MTIPELWSRLRALFRGTRDDTNLSAEIDAHLDLLAADHVRRAKEFVDAGLLGDVTEVQTWTNRPVWPQGIPTPTGKFDIPKELDWDLWLGPAKFIDYNPVYYLIGSSFAILTTYIAGWLPARKASKVDPVVIIRGK